MAVAHLHPEVGPPAFSIRVSARARRVRLVVSERQGLVVVVPRGFDRRKIPGILEARRDWVERATARVEAGRRVEVEPARLPERIELPAVAEEWEVEYRPANPGGAGAVVRERSGRHLVVTGDLGDVSACRDALCRWLVRRARRSLIPWLEELANQRGFDYDRVSVRRQRTLWASCSRRRTISLNVRLLFLPEPVVEYVLVHELCHTVEMNHSARFWALLGSFDPDCREHKRLLRQARESMPAWLDGEIGSRRSRNDQWDLEP